MNKKQAVDHHSGAAAANPLSVSSSCALPLDPDARSQWSDSRRIHAHTATHYHRPPGRGRTDTSGLHQSSAAIPRQPSVIHAQCSPHSPLLPRMNDGILNEYVGYSFSNSSCTRPSNVANPPPKGQQQQQQQSHSGPTIPAVSVADLTSEQFYREYVLKRRPCVLRGGLGGVNVNDSVKPGASGRSMPGGGGGLVGAVGGDSITGEFHVMAQNWASPSYLKQHVGHARVRVEWKSDTVHDASSSHTGSLNKSGASKVDTTVPPSQFGRGQHIWMQFSEFLDLIHFDAQHSRAPLGSEQFPSPKNHSFYLTSQPIETDPISGLPIDVCVEPITSLLPDLPLRPRLLEQLTPIQFNCWIGRYKHIAQSAGKHDIELPDGVGVASVRVHPLYRSVGSSSGLHHDYHDNLYTLLSGCKVFHLYPPDEAVNLYTHGMNPTGKPRGAANSKKRKQRPASSESDTDDSAIEHVDSDSNHLPASWIHPNGVIEYFNSQSQLQAAFTCSLGQPDGKRHAQQKSKRQLLEEQAGDEDESSDDEVKVDDSSDPASKFRQERALYESRVGSLNEQLAELSAKLGKLQKDFKYLGPGQEKKQKHYSIEIVALQKKVDELKTKIQTVEMQEAQRQRIEAQSIKAAKRPSRKGDTSHADTGSDSDSSDIMSDFVDDYQGSELDESVGHAGGSHDAVSGDEDDEDDDEDVDLDPAEKAAWAAFRESTLSDSKIDTASSSAAIHNSSSGTASGSASTPASPTSFPPNFSKIDFSCFTPEQIRQQFPRFAPSSKGLSTGSRTSGERGPMAVQLLPGDMLYLPASWFHEVFSSNAPELPSIAASSDHSSSSKTKAAIRSHVAPIDRFRPDVHFALNYWFEPPVLRPNGESADVRPMEDRWQRYYLPRLEKKIKSVMKRRQQALSATRGNQS